MGSVNAMRPTSEGELVEIIGAAGGAGARLRIRSGGSKDGVGAASSAGVLDMSGFSGIVDYDPSELVLTAHAATPLSDVMAAVAAEGQALAFDPFDHAPLFGHAPGAATLGGVIAGNVSGPRRLARGAARDHLLGFVAVSGRGERFIGGGKVVKNVTGYDLPKLMAGSWGRLAALTELTVKVLPRPRTAAMLRIHGLDAAAAVAAMAQAMGSPADVAAARHVPEGKSGPAVTELLIDGFPASVSARLGALADLLVGAVGSARIETIAADASAWPALDLVRDMPSEHALWKVSLRPSAAPGFVAQAEALGAQWAMDWAGGLVWVAIDDTTTRVRDLAVMEGGHAALMRAPDVLRAAVPAFQPAPTEVAALEERVRRAFDPLGVFETGRF
ncbi:MAG: FAD-binding protein [Novosphingobium sp.]